jgi:hypothetical protein
MERQIEVRRLRGEAREAHARGALARWTQSGLSAAAFARREGVNPVTLKRWRRAFGATALEAPAAGAFIELEFGARRSVGAFEVVLADGRAVRVLPGFDAAELARLLSVLERARC